MGEPATRAALENMGFAYEEIEAAARILGARADFEELFDLLLSWGDRGSCCAAAISTSGASSSSSYWRQAPSTSGAASSSSSWQPSQETSVAELRAMAANAVAAAVDRASAKLMAEQSAVGT